MSTKPQPAPAPAAAAATPAAADPSYPWHGYALASLNLPPPTCAVASDDLARPKYTDIKSAEYVDSAEVLRVKAKAVAKMFTEAKQRCIFAGAGLSTSSGIWDYASNAKGSLVQAKKRPLTTALVVSLKPTPAHRVLAAMEKKGLVDQWVQQNHDGLAQKAGFPVAKLNEIHGSWWDAANPVVAMSGQLRDDLFERVLDWEKRADFVFAIGTSFSGLNVDRVADAAAARHMKQGRGHGLVAVSIQKTPKDAACAVRVFAKCDLFMMLVAEELGIGAADIGTKVHKVPVAYPRQGYEDACEVVKPALGAPKPKPKKTAPPPPPKPATTTTTKPRSRSSSTTRK